MSFVAGVFSVLLILIILLDGFETIILPRRVNRKVRLARFFYLATWMPWRAVALRIQKKKKRESMLGFYGPISLLFLFAVWSGGLIIAFGSLQWAMGSQVIAADGRPTNFLIDLYMSGTTFFTLGLGDITPHSVSARMLTVVEAGMGFAMMAAVIGYLPTLYQSFSSRETTISLLDARAGSPPSAYELLRRHAQEGALDELQQVFTEWERLAAQIMESHISYPVLCYYRSQHDNQSWMAALTAILDTCALVMAGVDGIPTRQARLTFAMARHAMVDLAQVFGCAPLPGACSRLSQDDRSRLRVMLDQSGVPLRATDEKLDELRLLYEPYTVSLASYLAMDLPVWVKPVETKDNWKTSAWTMAH